MGILYNFSGGDNFFSEDKDPQKTQNMLKVTLKSEKKSQ